MDSLVKHKSSLRKYIKRSLMFHYWSGTFRYLPRVELIVTVHQESVWETD